MIAVVKRMLEKTDFVELGVNPGSFTLTRYLIGMSSSVCASLK